ncbi:MAG: hypothetical protein K6T34_09255, partial [Thermoflavifilum sp.]|nr:hypothetical protein [Thermoflavifilum sp.]
EPISAIFLAVLNFLCFFLCFKTKKEGTCLGHFSDSLELSLLLSLFQDKERRSIPQYATLLVKTFAQRDAFPHHC